jgi:hypothetical protein
MAHFSEGDKMQTEELINESNGSAVVTDLSADYPFDAESLSAEIPHAGNIVAVHYRKPQVEDYLNRQSAQHSKTRIVSGAIVGSEIKHDADTEFFDAIVEGAEKRSASGKVIQSYDAEACQRFPFEFKLKFVKRITTSRFRVVAQGDELSDAPSTLTVIQTIGDEAAPSYVISYDMNALTEKQRTSYLNAAETKSRIKNGDTIIEAEPHYVERAMKLFGGDRNGKDGVFISLEGGRLQSGSFTPERKTEFVAQIDPLFQMGVIDAICDWFGGGQD